MFTVGTLAIFKCDKCKIEINSVTPYFLQYTSKLLVHFHYLNDSIGMISRGITYSTLYDAFVESIRWKVDAKMLASVPSK